MGSEWEGPDQGSAVSVACLLGIVLGLLIILALVLTFGGN